MRCIGNWFVLNWMMWCFNRIELLLLLLFLLRRQLRRDIDDLWQFIGQWRTWRRLQEIRHRIICFVHGQRLWSYCRWHHAHRIDAIVRCTISICHRQTQRFFAGRLRRLLLTLEIRLDRILLKCFQCRVGDASRFTRIQINEFLTLATVDAVIVLHATVAVPIVRSDSRWILTFQFIDTIRYRLPIMTLWWSVWRERENSVNKSSPKISHRRRLLTWAVHRSLS